MKENTTHSGHNQPPIFRQIAGAVLGIVFTAMDNRTGFELIAEFFIAPLMIAGIIRLVIGLYRLLSNLTGQKVYDELGQCVMTLSRPGITSILTIVAFACLLSVLVSILQFSTFLGLVIIFALMGIEVYIFIKDFRQWKLLRQHN